MSQTPAKPFLPPRWFIRAAWAVHRAIYRVSDEVTTIIGQSRVLTDDFAPVDQLLER